MSDRVKHKLIAVLVLTASFFWAGSCFAQDRYVAIGASNVLPYTDWTIAASNLADAVALANNGATVWVGTGTYVLDAPVTIFDTTVRGAGTNPADFVFSGGGVTNCFILRHANAELNTVMVSNAYQTALGSYSPVYIYPVAGGSAKVLNSIIGWSRAFFGGAMTIASPAIISNCLMIANTAGASVGGAIYLNANSVTVTHCRIIGNIASGSSGGGGIAIRGGSLVRDCTIVSNQVLNSRDGGGISVYSPLTGPTRVENCLIEANTATDEGGGIYIGLNSDPDILANSVFENCIILSNVAKTGGGVYQTSLTLRNCLVVGNSQTGTATGSAGGLHMGGGDVTSTARVENCTIVDNTGGTGGGIRAGAAAMDGIYNTIIVSNWWNSTNIDVTVSTPAYTNKFFYCCAPTNLLPSGQGNLNANPFLMNHAEGDYKLRSNSPCRNAGANQVWWMEGALDLNNRPRIDRFSGKVDMGAYEYVPEGMLFKAK